LTGSKTDARKIKAKLENGGFYFGGGLDEV